MNVVQETAEGLPVWKLSGKLDTLTSPDFQKQIVEAIDKGQTRLILDITDLAYVSSAGLRVFLIAQKKASAGRGSLAILGANDMIKNVFEISGFTRLFCFTGDLKESVDYLKRLQS